MDDLKKNVQDIIKNKVPVITSDEIVTSKIIGIISKIEKNPRTGATKKVIIPCMSPTYEGTATFSSGVLPAGCDFDVGDTVEFQLSKTRVPVKGGKTRMKVIAINIGYHDSWEGEKHYHKFVDAILNSKEDLTTATDISDVKLVTYTQVIAQGITQATLGLKYNDWESREKLFPGYTYIGIVESDSQFAKAEDIYVFVKV